MTASAKCSVARSTSSWAVRAMSRVVPTRTLASFTTDSRHCSWRSRSSWKARTPVSDVRAMYAIDSAISLRAAALIDSASLVSRGSSSSSRSRTRACARGKARSIAVTGFPR
ncbi:hypothetical protein Save01_08740 [Streptomyces avermitilis]